MARVHLSVGTTELLGACLAVVLLGWLYAGVGLFVGALSGRRAIALGASLALALGAFLLYSLGPLVDALRPGSRSHRSTGPLATTHCATVGPRGYACLLVLVRRPVGHRPSSAVTSVRDGRSAPTATSEAWNIARQRRPRAGVLSFGRGCRDSRLGCRSGLEQADAPQVLEDQVGLGGANGGVVGDVVEDECA